MVPLLSLGALLALFSTPSAGAPGFHAAGFVRLAIAQALDSTGASVEVATAGNMVAVSVRASTPEQNPSRAPDGSPPFEPAAPSAPAVPFPGRAAPAPPATPRMPAMPGAGGGNSAGYGAGQGAATGHGVVFTSIVGDVRVDLAFHNAPVRDAIRQVLEQAKQEWALERNVPADCRVTLCAARVRLSTALDALTEAAGVGWSAQPRYEAATRTVRTLIRVGGTPPPALFLDAIGKPGAAAGISLRQFTGIAFGQDPSGAAAAPFPPFPTAQALGAMPSFPTVAPSVPGDRITFTCRHCHAQISTIRPRVQPLCPRCGRRFHADWQFCPHDGAKRPPAPGEWRFCPVCGKPVDGDHADMGDPDAEHPAEQIERTGETRPDASPRKSDWDGVGG